VHTILVKRERPVDGRMCFAFCDVRPIVSYCSNCINNWCMGPDDDEGEND